MTDEVWEAEEEHPRAAPRSFRAGSQSSLTGGPPSYGGSHAQIGGPLAGTQPFEKLFSKPDFGDPNGLFPLGSPSIEVWELLKGLGPCQGPS